MLTREITFQKQQPFYNARSQIWLKCFFAVTLRGSENPMCSVYCIRAILSTEKLSSTQQLMYLKCLPVIISAFGFSPRSRQTHTSGPLRSVWFRSDHVMLLCHSASVHSLTLHLRYQNQEDTPKGPLMLDHPLYQWVAGTSTNWCSNQYAWFGRPKRPSVIDMSFQKGRRRCKSLWIIRYDLPLDGGLRSPLNECWDAGSCLVCMYW